MIEYGFPGTPTITTIVLLSCMAFGFFWGWIIRGAREYKKKINSHPDIFGPIEKEEY